MGRKSTVKYLPRQVLSELNPAPIESDFSGWDDHAQWLLSQGYAVHRSSLHRYGVAAKARHEQEQDNPAHAQARTLCLEIAAAQCENASPAELIAYADQLLKWVAVGTK